MQTKGARPAIPFYIYIYKISFRWKRIFAFVRRFCLPLHIGVVYCTELYQKRKFFKINITHTAKPGCSVINALKRKCNMNFTCL